MHFISPLRKGRWSGRLPEVPSSKILSVHQGNKTNFSLQDCPPCSPRSSWTLPEFLLLHKSLIKCSLVQIPALIFSLPSTLSSYHHHHFSVKRYHRHLPSPGRNWEALKNVGSRTGLQACSNIWSSQSHEIKKEKQQQRNHDRTSNLLN